MNANAAATASNSKSQANLYPIFMGRAILARVSGVGVFLPDPVTILLKSELFETVLKRSKR